MTAVTDDLTIPQGADWGRAWPIYNSDRTALLDLTGWTVRAQVKRHPGEPVLFEWSTNPAAGQGTALVTDGRVTLLVRAATSLAWQWRRGEYDVRLTDLAGTVYDGPRGAVVVDAAVTAVIA